MNVQLGRAKLMGWEAPILMSISVLTTTLGPLPIAIIFTLLGVIAQGLLGMPLKSVQTQILTSPKSNPNGFMKTVVLYLFMATRLVSSYGQGTVLFNNYNVGGSPNAPVLESDGITKVSGPQFTAELFAGPSANSLAAIAMVGFSTGTQAGYFFGNEQYINSVRGGDTAWIEIDVWNTRSGNSFADAQASGLPDSWWQSSIFSVVTGNLFTGAGPTPPALLSGLGNSSVFLNGVPEPSTLALAGLGGALSLFYLRRRRT